MQNNVRALRVKAGLTQTLLAQEIGTSQQQIHRIEQGQAAKLDLALRICHAFKTPMEKVFPKTRTTLRKLEKSSPSILGPIFSDPNVQEVLGKNGIDADPVNWFFKLQLSNGITRVYSVAGPERHRLARALRANTTAADEVSFLVFETDCETVALNRRALAYAHLLFEPMPTETGGEPGRAVTVYFVNHTEPLVLGMLVDERPEHPDDPDPEEAQLACLIGRMQGYVGKDDLFELEDEDGEVAFMRADSVALMEIPKELTHGPAEDDEEADA